jgi:hypothetical protein
LITRDQKNLLLSFVNLLLFVIMLAKFWQSPDLVGVPMRLWLLGCPFVIVPLMIPAIEQSAGHRLRGGLLLLAALGLAHTIGAYLRQDPTLWLTEALWSIPGLIAVIVYYLPEPAAKPSA